MNWHGRKKQHDKCFMGIDKNTRVQYSNCIHCNRMWADGKEMTKTEIREYLKRPSTDFIW